MKYSETFTSTFCTQRDVCHWRSTIQSKRRLSDPSQYQSIVDAEWNIIYDKLDKCVKSGAKIILSRLAIGDLATQYFAERDVF
ncbi:T-complex protein 1 subunit eta-like [Coffea arabica]|uniref:T-complex protein 1 subunit eta-like n=1 Tax=Coffea arabica TaxID=13443 RepID=A0ABM4V3Y6_COFAR